jgi:hypothetical protein
MDIPTLSCARALRDGGIDAAAALNEALKEALVGIHVANHGEIKRHFGRVMAAVLDETVDTAVRAFPELEPDEETWLAVVKFRAAARAAA